MYRNFPFLGQESTWAAQAADCAAAQGRFWELHDVLFNNQAGENRGAFSRDRLKRFAGQAGVDQAQFNRCLDTDQTLTQVQAELAEGRAQGVKATPTLFVGTQKFEGVPRWQDLLASVERQISQ